MNGRTRPLILCAAVALLVVFGACAEPQAPKEESHAANSQPTANSQTTASNGEAPAAVAANDASAPASPTPAPSVNAPPSPSEVRAALQRIYKDAVVFDERAAHFVVGDFNGDGSEDIAVAARPSAAKLSDLNDELANWIVTDPRLVRPPDPRSFDPHQGVQKLAPTPSRAHVASGDTLLVVIHGFKGEGWRNPEALQTYLLKNAAGSPMDAQTRADAQAALHTKTLRLLGDVIHENLRGESGFIYWTGASYGWTH
jgi:hypothetical protein